MGDASAEGAKHSGKTISDEDMVRLVLYVSRRDTNYPVAMRYLSTSQWRDFTQVVHVEDLQHPEEHVLGCPAVFDKSTGETMYGGQCLQLLKSDPDLCGSETLESGASSWMVDAASSLSVSPPLMA